MKSFVKTFMVFINTGLTRVSRTSPSKIFRTSWSVDSMDLTLNVSVQVLVPARSRGQTSDDRPSERSAESQEETTEIKLPDLSSDEDDVDDEGRPGQSAEEDSQDVVVGDVIKTAEVMIHPRADCPVYPFKKR